MNETDQEVALRPTVGFQEAMKSSLHRFRARAGNAAVSRWEAKGFVSLGISPRPGYYSPPSALSFFFLFFLPWWEEGLLSPQPCAGGALTFGGLRMVLRLVAVRPVQTPDGWLGAGGSAVGRGMCVVDGSIHCIGCWHVWGWGGSAPRCRPGPAAARCGAGGAGAGFADTLAVGVP